VSGIDSSSFASEIRRAEPGLARAALLFAREIAYPELLPSQYLAVLDRWADNVQRRLNPADTVLTRVGHLSDYLFGVLALKGNTADYTDPRNSYLNEVIDRRLGLPISLSVVFIEVARRIGLSADGVGLPGHYIVAVKAEAGRYFFDPFHGGAEVTDHDAAELVRAATGYAGSLEPAWLSATSTQRTLARMLNNLHSVYTDRESWGAAVAVVARLRIVEPDVAEHSRDLGLLHVRNNSPRQALALLEEYLERAPEAQDAAAVRARAAALLDRYAKLN
jgi:regulator of sirC expression with transglutaminase-like and TPR domain